MNEPIRCTRNGRLGTLIRWTVSNEYGYAIVRLPDGKVELWNSDNVQYVQDDPWVNVHLLRLITDKYEPITEEWLKENEKVPLTKRVDGTWSWNDTVIRTRGQYYCLCVGLGVD